MVPGGQAAGPMIRGRKGLKYEVSWCLLGKEPDCAPYEFGFWDDAVKFMHDELWYLARDLQDYDAHSSCLAAMNKLSYARLAEPENLCFIIGNISYWISFTDPLDGLWKL